MVWFSFDEHTFRHPWATVVEAAIRKYPNPETPNVSSNDIFDRMIDENGIMHSKRIISSVWTNQYSQWMAKVTGLDLTKTVNAIEYSKVDPTNKIYELTSRNLNFMDYIVVDEKLTYTAHPSDPDITKLKQEWRITCKNVSFIGFLESAMGKSMMGMSVKGRQGIEWVISQLRDEVERLASPLCEEVERLAHPALEEMQQLASSTMKEISSLQENIGDLGKRWEENLHDELTEFINQSGPRVINESAAQN